MLKKTCTVCDIEKPLDGFSIINKKKQTYRGTCKLCRTERDRVSAGKPERKYKEYKYEASRRNLDFKLTLSQFKSFKDKPCHYCGSELEFISLDRVDNDLGYYIENVVSSCFTCNSIKHVYDKDYFLRHIEKIFMYQQKVKNGKQENSG